MYTIFILEENIIYIISTNFQFPLKEKTVVINRLDVLIWSLFLYHQNCNVSAKYLVILYFYWYNNADKSEYK